MVGGVVDEVVVKDGERLWVNCRCRVRPKDTCAILVKRSGRADEIEVGDSLWWGHGRIYWTPKSVVDGGPGESDVILERASYSGVNRPSPVN